MAADPEFCISCGNHFPAGQRCSNCQQDGMPTDPMTPVQGITAMHHEWFEAWQEAGFTEAQAFELTKVAVAQGFS
jgi:hypothetical protein